MRILKGKYKACDNTLHPALWISFDTCSIGVADFHNTTYTFYGASDFIKNDEQDEEKVQSAVFPRVTDFFAQPLKEMTIVFQEQK